MENVRELEKILDSGEAIQWSGRPDLWRYTRPAFIIYIVGVPWTIFTFGWLYAITDGFKIPGKVVYPYPAWTPWVAIGAGVILLAAGLWMLSAPFWIWLRGKTVLYALTDRRALTLEIGSPKKTQFLSLAEKVSFRIADPDERISDLDVICGPGNGLLFRAVVEPQKVVERLEATFRSARTDSPFPN